jgi:hypothetical protein
VRRLARICISLLALLALCAPAVSSARPQRGPLARRASSLRALLRSRELWATIDVCNTAKQPETVGVRGSMPGDGHARDAMSMSFHLEYLNAVNQWVELEGSGSSGFIAVGSAGASRQGGSSFTLKPHPGKPAYTLRGVVDFRWTHGKTIMQTARRPTMTGHEAAVGAEPKGYSSAECSVG